MSRLNEKWNCPHERKVDQKDLLGQHISTICLDCKTEWWNTAYYMKFIKDTPDSSKGFNHPKNSR